MAAADGVFKCVYEGCIAGCDNVIERRPYHRNCTCALHESRKTSCSSHGLPKSKSVSYPIRKSWSEGCLALAAAAGAVGSAASSPSASPAVVSGGKIRRLGSCEVEDEDRVVFFKVGN